MRPDLAAQLRMRWIPAGRYLRGSTDDDSGALSDEKPQHEVVLTRGFWLSDAPVTQALWVAVMGTNPSRFEGAARPVDGVSWEDCQRFCTRLSRLCPGLHPRLPTEAEWEYAARAGTTTPRYGVLDDIGWFGDNSGDQTHSVRHKQPNSWGVYDMLGNVWEWCQDRWDDGEAYSPDAELQVDPLSCDGSKRVFRGGSWCDDARTVRAAYRFSHEPGTQDRNLGFRLAGGRTHRSGANRGRAESDGVTADPGEEEPRRGKTWPPS